MTDLTDLTIMEALQGLRSGTFTCRGYVEALISQSEALEKLNALVAHDREALRLQAAAVDASGAAGKRLAGIPLCFKDNMATGLLPAGAATPALRGHVSKRPATVVRRLLEAGALVGGVGNMHELAFGITSNNPSTGAVRNPWNPDMIPGGSSGGVAAAVAARMMPGGIGTDTGGSVRLPASLCGLVGFRPTTGRYPADGCVPISATRDTPGPMARSVADIRLLDAIIAQTTPGFDTAELSAIRLGVPRNHFYDDLDPAVSGNAEKVLEAISRAGVTLVEVEIADVAALNRASGFPVAIFEFMRDLPAYLAAEGLDMTMRAVCDKVATANVRAMIEGQLGSAAVSEAVYRTAMEVHRPRLQAAYSECFAGNRLDGIIFPTAPLPARPIGDDEMVELNGRRVPTFATFIRNTDPGAGAGLPGISLPSGLSPAGLPLGMEIDGPAGSDARLLAIGAAIEPLFDFRETAASS